MALFKNLGKSHSRAAEIISQIKPNNEPETKPATDVLQKVETAPEKTELPPTPPETITKPEAVQTVVPEQSTVKEKTEGLTPGEQAQPPEKTPEIKEPEKTPPVQAPEITESEMFSFLSEKLNRKVESIDDLTIQEEKALDPEVKQLLEWKEKTGLSLSRWSDYNKDFSKMGDLEVAREILSQKYPNLNKEEIEYSLKDYIYNEDFDDESDKIKKSISLKKLAADGRRTLEDKRLELVSEEKNPRLTKQQLDDLDFAQQARKNQESMQSNQELYKQDLHNAALSLDAINLQLSDDLTIKYDVSEGDRKTLPERILNMPEWYNEDGSVNHANIVRDGLKIRDFDSIVKKAYEQGISVGKEGKIKADKNITIDTPSYPTTQDGEAKKGNINQVINQISGGPKKKLRFGRVEK